MSDTIAATTIVNPAIIEAFKSAIKAVRTNAGTALRVTFIKKDNSTRVMDVAFDADLEHAFASNPSYTVQSANAKRNATNEARNNLVVRERLTDEAGNHSFQWRTIPLSRIVAVGIC